MYSSTTIFLMMCIPFLFVVCIIPIVKKIANYVGALDIPNARKVHTVPTPRLGGLGVYGGFLLGYMIFGEHTPTMNSILIGSFVLIITGMIDDIKPMPAKPKFLCQTIAALIVVIYGQLLFKEVSFFGINIDFGYFSYPLTILFILGCINSINFIDGLDGLSSGIASIFFLTIGIIASFQGRYGLPVVLTFTMLGSTMGFLIHNFNPATIFLGDTGSMFIGFIISVITLLGFKTLITSSIIIPLCILIVPILDTMCAIIRRKLKGESIDTPDKCHFHHQFIKRNLSVKTTVLIIYLITALFSTASVIWLLVSQKIGYIIYGVLTFMLVIFVLSTDIIFEHKKKEKTKKSKK